MSSGDILISNLTSINDDVSTTSALFETKHGFALYDMGEISHPKYGKAIIKIKIPNALPPNQIKTHSAESKTAAKEFIVNWMKENGVLYTLGTTGERDTIINGAVDFADTFNLTEYALDSELFICCIGLCMVAIYVDDLYESIFSNANAEPSSDGDGSDTSGPKEMEESLRTIANDILVGKYKKLQDVPTLAIPVLQPVLWMNYMCYEQMSRIRPSNFATLIQPVIKEQNNYIQALLLMAKQGFLNSCSDETYMSFRVFDTGARVAIALTALLNDKLPSDKIKSNLIYKRIKTLLCEIIGLTNDLFGIEKDMELDLPVNLILRRMARDGLTLQESVDKVINEILIKTADFIFLANELEAEFENIHPEVGVSTYVQSLRYALDGHFRMFTTVSRWRLLSVEYVE